VPQIEVEQRDDVEQFLSRFLVRVSDEQSSTSHEVTLSRSDYERLRSGFPSPDALVTACFEFLLSREPKEQILRSFDVGRMQTYFPEFEREIGRFAPGGPQEPA
jgi:hypothetical protein